MTPLSGYIHQLGMDDLSIETVDLSERVVVNLSGEHHGVRKGGSFGVIRPVASMSDRERESRESIRGEADCQHQSARLSWRNALCHHRFQVVQVLLINVTGRTIVSLA